MKKIILFLVVLSLLVGVFLYYHKVNYFEIEGIIQKNSNNILTLKTEEDINYYFNNTNIKEDIGTKIKINCNGKLLEDSDKIQNCKITSYEVLKQSDIPHSWLDNGIFSDYYLNAFELLKTLTLEDKIAQTLLVRYQDENILNIQKDYQFGGFIFFEKDFKNKTKNDVISMINNLQSVSNIPILTAIDEEGGIVSRISSNKNLVESPFLSSQELYQSGGFSKIKDDVINKSSILKELGLNLNLAPVVDVSTNPEDYIYKRSLGLNTELTSIYAKTVIEASKNTGVSYTLKHFPGYSNNIDTHKTSSVDEKSYEDILKIDIPPFTEGINAGAEAIMNSHNIVKSIENVPASLSIEIHKLLRNNLNFTGIIITDDLSMGAVSNIENKEIKALKAGNNILITSDFIESFNTIKKGIENNLLKEEELNKLVFNIIAWKYYKKLL